MNKDLSKLLSYVTEIRDDEDLTQLESFYIRFPRGTIPGAKIRFIKDNRKKAIACARAKLPKIIELLPEYIVNDEIINFIHNAYKNPTITDLTKLCCQFDTHNLNLYNAVVKMYNVYIDDVIDTETFAMYPAETFFKQVIIPNKPLERHFFNIISNTFAPNEDNKFSVLILKKVPYYKPKPEISIKIIKERSKTICAIIGLLLSKLYQTKNLGEFLSDSLHAICYFNEEMQPVIAQNKCGLYKTFYQDPVFIEKELLDKNGFMLSLILATDGLLYKIKRGAEWLAKSTMAEQTEDRILYAMIALECILSRNSKSPIQPSLQNSLSETFAFLAKDNATERKEMFRFLKNVYEIRSKIVHTGYTTTEQSLYVALFEKLKAGLFKLLTLIEERDWKDIKEVYDYVEELKFS